jgi:hypothetical protein
MKKINETESGIAVNSTGDGVSASSSGAIQGISPLLFQNKKPEKRKLREILAPKIKG